MRIALLCASLLLLAACSASADPQPKPSACAASEATPAELYDRALAAHRANRGAQALELMTRSAEGGWVHAQFELGTWHYLAINTPRDAEAAAQWLDKAARQDHVEAQVLLAQMYLFGSGIAPNSKLALKWFTRAAELGNVEAQYRVGLAHYEGVGTPEDPVEAAIWMEKAATQGHEDAMYHLAVLKLECAQGATPTAAQYAVAFDWFSRAADLGHGPSMLAVGDCYEKGLAVGQDMKLARDWYEKAARSEDAKVSAEAKKRLAALK